VRRVVGEPASTVTHGEDRCADRFYASEIHPRERDLRHGVHIDIAKTEGDDRYVAISFASIYVVACGSTATSTCASFARASAKHSPKSKR